MALSISWPTLTTQWFTIFKIYSKIFCTSCADHGVTVMEVDGHNIGLKYKKMNISRTKREFFIKHKHSESMPSFTKT